MSAVHISNLRLSSFRGFKSLELLGLKSVNLIVGQNNTGKTSLLESICLAADPKMFGYLPTLLRPSFGDHNRRFFRWLVMDQTVYSNGHIYLDGPDFKNDVWISTNQIQGIKNVTVLMSGPFCKIIANNPVASKLVKVISTQQKTPESLVPTVGSAIRRKQGEDQLHSILKKVDPRIQRLRVDPVEEGNIVAVDVGLSEMIPISQLGQGVYRLVSILSVLVGESPQICIIDEIENGIHYTALKQIWRGIKEISNTLGIQIFATTHSHECLEAANSVFFDEDPQNEVEFAVIQLMRLKDEITGKVIGEERVNAALENDIELR